MKNMFLKDDIYQQFLSICKLQMGRPSLRRLLRSLFSDVGGNEREREVSFPKIILRPHFKKENLRLFWGAGYGGGG